jgi:hypothetical protein
MRMEGKEMPKRILIVRSDGRREVTQKLRQTDNEESNLRKTGVGIWKD